MADHGLTARFFAGDAVGARLKFVLGLLLVAGLLGYLFRDGLGVMWGSWSQEEYGHGYLIPFVAGYLVWQNRGAGGAGHGAPTWWGTLVLLCGLVMLLMGELGTIYTVIQYAFLVTLYGLVLALFGWPFVRRHWAALLYLVFMIPLPEFFYNGLSSQLQLISSQLGVAVIRLFDISVFLDGNVIDLGVYKLQVVEACSGLRYLFPLMSFGYLCAYLYRGPKWQKLVLFLSTIPITVLMNSLRIGVIGVLVELYGIEMAEGFLHQFEGWVIFMACVLILFFEVWVLTRLTAPGESVFDHFRVGGVRSVAWNSRRLLPAFSRPFAGCLVLTVVATIAVAALGDRAEAKLEREVFVSFPMRVADWRGRDQALPQELIDELDVDDYLLANYRRDPASEAVNLYVAYYNSQRKGEAVHSPQSCIPGDGWRIEDFAPAVIESVKIGGRPMPVNRVVIVKGDSRQLVYYWFPQRERILTNEYQVKWYLFQDALLRNRTDGALVRLVTPVVGQDGMAAAERRLSAFAAAVVPRLTAYLPG